MPLKKRAAEIIIIVVTAVASGLVKNHIDPDGIAIIGQWDKSKGAVSAVSKTGIANVESLEIKSVRDAKKIYDTGKVIFVDARDYEAYSDGRVKGAVSLPVGDFQDKGFDFFEKFPSDTMIVTYCSGRECEDSHTLAKFLKDIGFINVHIMIDGYPGWKNGGYPVEKN